MARNALAQEILFSLRREISRIEGGLSERLSAPEADNAARLRRGISADQNPFLKTGEPRLDEVLGGGVPRAALTEIHGSQTRDAGAAAGFTLALIALFGRTAHPDQAPRTVCWIGIADLFREAGFPYAPGLKRLFGLDPGDFLFANTERIADALWIAEEAARQKDFRAVVLEIRGNPARLDLTAVRRLHRRAQQAGRPVFLIRQAAVAEPTPAPLRLAVSAAPAVPRQKLGGLLEDMIGHPAFTVVISKSRMARSGRFILEWNPDEQSLREIRPTHPGALVAISGDRSHLAAEMGSVVALRSASRKEASPGGQSSREERAVHPGPRRAG